MSATTSKARSTASGCGCARTRSRSDVATSPRRPDHLLQNHLRGLFVPSLLALEIEVELHRRQIRRSGGNPHFAANVVQSRLDLGGLPGAIVGPGVSFVEGRSD